MIHIFGPIQRPPDPCEGQGLCNPTGQLQNEAWDRQHWNSQRKGYIDDNPYREGAGTIRTPSYYGTMPTLQ